MILLFILSTLLSIIYLLIKKFRNFLIVFAEEDAYSQPQVERTASSPFMYTHGIEKSEDILVGPEYLPTVLFKKFVKATSKHEQLKILKTNSKVALYFKGLDDINFRLSQLTKYPFGINTLDVNNTQLLKYFLSIPKNELTSVEILMIKEILNRRQCLMDLAGIYHFTKINKDFKEFLFLASELDPTLNIKTEFENPSRGTLRAFGLWNNLEYRFKNARSAYWEDWKEIHGYHNQYNMAMDNDFYAFKEDIRIHEANETEQLFDEDHIGGRARDRVSSAHLGEVFHFERMNQARAYTFLQSLNSRMEYIEKSDSNFGFWGFRDYFLYRNQWPISYEEYMLIHTRHKHLKIVVFQELTIKRAIIYAQKMKLASKYILEVVESKKTLRDKNVSFFRKVYKVLSGDVWIQEMFPYMWGIKKKKIKVPSNSDLQKEKEKYWAQELRGGEAPESITSLAEFDHNKIAFEKRLKGIHGLMEGLQLEKLWPVYNPSLVNNKYYFYKYFDPWLTYLQANNRKPYGSFNTLNIFWFKYSHTEFTFLRRADGSRVDPIKFQGGWLYRSFERKMQRIWLREAPRGRSGNYAIDQTWQAVNKDVGLLYAKVPISYLPISIETKYYEYNGPASWIIVPYLAFIDETDPEDWEQYVGTYIGPSFLPIAISYKHWIECFDEREKFFYLYKTSLYFLKATWTFIIPKFLLYIFCIYFIYLVIYFFLLQVVSSNEIEPRYWPCVKTLHSEPWTTKTGEIGVRNFYLNEDGSNPLRFRSYLNLLAKSRNNFNILVSMCIFIIPCLFIIIPLIQGPAEFFLISKYFRDLLSCFGSFSLIAFIQFHIPWLIRSYYKEIQKIKFIRIFFDYWDSERRKTWELEKKYEAAYIKRYTELYGVRPECLDDDSEFKWH